MEPASAEGLGPDGGAGRPWVLLLNVLIVAACGLVYELLAGTVASYVLGDSVTQFSLVIGVYLSAMGVGAWLSRFIAGDLARRFVDVEISVALFGGCSAPLLFFCFGHLKHFHAVLFGTVFIVGVLVGLEIPLLMRLLKDRLEFKDLVSRVLTFDYLGALIASILFPVFFVPKLGLVRTSLVIGLLNAGVALWAMHLLRPYIKGSVLGLQLRVAAVVVLLGAGFSQAERLTTLAEEALFANEIVYAHSTPYQRIIVTKGRESFQLFLNGHLQFNSHDEHRYHEALVHPALILQGAPKRVLVMGGGDGLALREILRFPGVESVTLVDLDEGMTSLSRAFPPLAELNQHSFDDPRVAVINTDGLVWLRENSSDRFDAAIVDFPDPSTYSLGKLYTRDFYRLIREHLSPGGTLAVQSTSPFQARQSFWCIERTIEAAGFFARPYQVSVPSFGVWGFVLASETRFDPPTKVPLPTRFLTAESLPGLFDFNADTSAPDDIEINRLDNQALVRYYEEEVKHWE